MLVLAEYYLPGYKAGGLTRSVANFVADVQERCEVFVLTRDRDLGDEGPYPNVRTREWLPNGRAQVAYVNWRLPRDLAWMVRQLLGQSVDVVYLNSYMGVFSSILPLLLRRLGLLRRPVLLAPRGELSASALAIKRHRKRFYLAVARALGLHQGVTFHTSTSLDATDAVRLHPRSRVLVSADRITPAGPPEPWVPADPVRLVQLGRIVPIKNTLRVIESLHEVAGEVRLDLWGPVQDSSYWDICRQAISRTPPNVRVTHRGLLPPEKVQSTLAGYHASVLWSRSENFGQAVAESLAAGCPVIVSRGLHWAELVDGEAGWAVDPDDVERARALMRRVVQLPDEEWQRLRRGCVGALAKALAEHGGLDSLELLEAACSRPDEKSRCGPSGAPARQGRR